MKVYYNIEQGSPEWHELRYGKITGITSKGIFVDSETLLNEIISCRMEPFKLEPPGYQSEDMLRGNELEPFARMELSRKIGVKLLKAGWIESETIKIIGISPDAISECETIACETKCPGRSAHTAMIRENEIPLKYIPQCLHYFTANEKLKELHFASFRPESKIRLFHKVLTHDSIINMGTKSKPVMKSVLEFANIARGNAMKIDVQVDAFMDSLESLTTP